MNHGREAVCLTDKCVLNASDSVCVWVWVWMAKWLVYGQIAILLFRNFHTFFYWKRPNGNLAGHFKIKKYLYFWVSMDEWEFEWLVYSRIAIGPFTLKRKRKETECTQINCRDDQANNCGTLFFPYLKGFVWSIFLHHMMWWWISRALVFSDPEPWNLRTVNQFSCLRNEMDCTSESLTL